jgi:hypothetical protein
MSQRSRNTAAVAGVFVAVAVVAIALVALGGKHDSIPAGTQPRTSTIQGTASAEGYVGPNVIRLTSPPRIVFVTGGAKPAPFQATPLPGACPAPAVPMGTTPPPCGG